MVGSEPIGDVRFVHRAPRDETREVEPRCACVKEPGRSARVKPTYRNPLAADGRSNGKRRRTAITGASIREYKTSIQT